jgi:hypothetical protein
MGGLEKAGAWGMRRHRTRHSSSEGPSEYENWVVRSVRVLFSRLIIVVSAAISFLFEFSGVSGDLFGLVLAKK